MTDVAPSVAAPEPWEKYQGAATGWQIVDFEGVRHEFPADFTQAEISEALARPPAGPRGAAAKPREKYQRSGAFDDLIPQQRTGAFDDLIPSAFPRGAAAPIVDPAPSRNGQPEGYQFGPNPAEPSPLDRMARGWQIGAQGVGRGAADIAGLPADIGTMVLNLGMAGADKVARQFGGSVDTRYGPSPIGGEAISDLGGQVARKVGVEPIAEAEMSPAERMGYSVNRFAAGNAAAGTGLARVAASRAASESGRMLRAGPQRFEKLMAPYRENAGRAITTDTVAGAGSGAALEAAHDNLPDRMQGPLTDIGAMLLGGFGGATATAGAKVPYRIGRSVHQSWPDPNIPVDPDTGLTVSRRSADKAARWTQQMTTEDPGVIAERIGMLANEASRHGDPVPSSGVLSGDIGLTASEKGARLRDPVPFQVRDQQLRDAAQDKVGGLRDPNADPMAPRRVVEQDVAEQRKAVQAPIDQARTELAGEQTTNAQRVSQAETSREAQLAQRDQGIASQKDKIAGSEQAQADIAGRVGGPRGTEGAASERLDKAVVQDTMQPMAAEQRAKYQAIDPEGKVVRDAQPLVDVVKEIRANVPRTVPASEVLPEAWLSRVEGLGEKVVEGPADKFGLPTKKKVGGEVTFKELNDMRPFLSDAIKGAETRGDYGYARNLRALKSHIDDEAAKLAGEGNPAGQRAQEAAAYTKDEFAPRFKQGAGGKLRDDITAGDKARTTTPPTATAERFLKPGPGGKEVAADLNRILSGSKSEADGKVAARDYVLADMARVADGGKINPNRLRVWIANREGMFSQMPGLKAEAEATLRDVVNGRAATTTLQKGLERMIADRRGAAVSSRKRIDEIKANAKLSEDQKREQIAALERTAADTEQGIQNSATSLLIDTDPAKAAARVFGSKDPHKAMSEITGKVAKDPEAAAGWKRAVTEHLIDRVTNTNTALTGTADGPVSVAKLKTFFDQNEKALAAVYTPDEMNALRRTHKILEPLGNLSRQATTGSPTAENNALLWRTLEAGLKVHYGVLKGGGVLRTLKVAAATLPDRSADAQRLVQRMWLDPELAQHLLTRKVADAGSPAWNAKLTRLLAYGQAGRESTEAE